MFRWGTVSVPLKPALERLLMSSGAGRRTNNKPNKPNKRVDLAMRVTFR